MDVPLLQPRRRATSDVCVALLLAIVAILLAYIATAPAVLPVGAITLPDPGAALATCRSLAHRARCAGSSACWQLARACALASLSHACALRHVA